MTNITRIDWTVKTGDDWWSGTNDTIKIEIYRDNTLLKKLNLEPGNTPRLDRSELVNYYWVFQDPNGLGVSVSGTTVPFYHRFPNGVAGHLRVKLITSGEDAWQKLFIDSTVTSGQLRHVPGTIDAHRWVEDWESFYFGQTKVLSRDSSEGFTSLTLNY